MLENRTYRNLITRTHLVQFQVTVMETDLLIHAEAGLTEFARESVFKYRSQLESYIQQYPDKMLSAAMRLDRLSR